MILSHRKARAYSTAILLVGLAFLFFFESFWPWIFVVIGSSLTFRSIALGRYYEGALNAFIFSALTLTYQFNISWSLVLPIILVISALYEIYKAYFDEVYPDEIEKIEDKQHEMEEKDQ